MEIDERTLREKILEDRERRFRERLKLLRLEVRGLRETFNSIDLYQAEDEDTFAMLLRLGDIIEKLYKTAEGDAEEVLDPFSAFHEAMRDEYRRHLHVKGDSWRRLSIPFLDRLLQEAMKEHLEERSDLKPHLVDVANLCAMLWTRLEETDQKAAEEGSP